MDAANLLKPMLARGELRCIGTTTLGEYRKYVEKDTAFERRFQQVYVGEATVLDTISVLRGIKAKYEEHHGVRIHDSALLAAAELSNRYINGRFLPDKVIDNLARKLQRLDVEALMLEKEEDPESKEKLADVRAAQAQAREEDAALRSKLAEQKERIRRMAEIKRALDDARDQVANLETPGHHARHGMDDKTVLDRVVEIKYHTLPRLEQTLAALQAQRDAEEVNLFVETVGPEQIAEVVARSTGIPVSRLTQTEREKVLTLVDRLQQQVVGQDKPVSSIANAVLRSRAGLGNSDRPTGCFLFLGPSGVGKTETARSLARELFNDEKMMVRIDMSEFLEAHSVYRLIGAPPGYVGYDQGGQLTEAVRRRPYSVVLCDEIEKAHPQVWNVLLQVMDDGRLTDGQGRVVNFKNSVIILTSNVGADVLLGGMTPQGLPKAVASDVMAKVKQTFPPEFLNRIDEVALYAPLSIEKMAAILRIQMKRYTEAFEAKKITVDLDDAAASHVCRRSFNPSMGARPLKRIVERVVMTSLSRLIFKGEIDSGCRVLISAGRGRAGECLQYHVTDSRGQTKSFAEEQESEDWSESGDGL